MHEATSSSRMKTAGPAIAFAVSVTAVAWLAPILGGSPSSPGLGFILWATAPLLVALVLRALTRDWSDVGWRPAIRKNGRWYLLSLLAYPAAMTLTLIAGTLTSVSSISGFSPGMYLRTVLTALLVFLVFAFFEEFGWRGYLSPKVASIGINRYVGHGLVGIVWAAWHLPYLSELTWVYTPENAASFIPRFFVASIVFSIVYGEIRAATGTFWPAVLMHGAGNAFGHPLAAGYVSVVAGKEYLGSIGTGLLTIVFFGLMGVVINRWRPRNRPLSR